MKRIVCDTNILISAFIFPGGPPDEIIHGVIMKSYSLGISGPIIEEFKKVLRLKFSWPEGKLAAGITVNVDVHQRRAPLNEMANVAG